MPIYPHAYNVTRDTQGAPQKYTIVFKTNDKGQVVLDYYRAALVSRGWVRPFDVLPLPAPTPRPYADTEGYFWADRTGNAPWKLVLTIDFWPDSVVHVAVARWPQIDKIPIYPGARQLGTQGNTKAAVQSYLTEASPAVIDASYQDLMPQYGWRLAGVNGMDLSFTYQLWGPELMLAVLGASISIVSRNGQTMVEIHAGGVDETTTYWRELWARSK